MSKQLVLAVTLTCSMVEASVFEADQFRDDRNKGSSNDENGISFSLTGVRQFMPLEFTKAGANKVKLLVNVSDAHAGATLRVGEWIPQEGRAHFVDVTLQSTKGADKWITVGDVYFQEAGTRLVFLRAMTLAGNGELGFVKKIDLSGKGEVKRGYFKVGQFSAIDFRAPTVPDCTAKYTETFSSDWPVLSGGGCARMTGLSGGYVKVMGPIGMSIWNSNRGNPLPVVAPNGGGYFSNEGSGTGTKRYDWNNGGYRMASYATRTTTGTMEGEVITSVCGRVIGEPWHLAGRIREWRGDGVGGISGFLENPSTVNAAYYRNTYAMGNPWTHAKATVTWKQSEQVSIKFRRSGNVHGRSYAREDMAEVAGGGSHYGVKGTLKAYPMLKRPQPLLPSLALICDLNDEGDAYKFKDASVARNYEGTVHEKVRDLFSSNPFDYKKMDGPSWLTLSPTGKFGGKPSASDVGLNVFKVRSYSGNMGVECINTIAIYVKKLSNNAPVFFNLPTLAQTAATMDGSEVLHIYVIDPDSQPILKLADANNSAFSIVRPATRNKDGLWDFLLKKTGIPAVGDHIFKLMLTDGVAVVTKSLNLTVVSPTHGVTVEAWYLCWDRGTKDLSELTKHPDYPHRPHYMGTSEECISHGDASNGSRVTGYITPPKNGTYTFTYTGEENVQLKISTDASEANLVLKSSGDSVTLKSSSRYYFELLSWNHSSQLSWEGPGIDGLKLVGGDAVQPTKYVRPQYVRSEFTLRSAITGSPYTKGHLAQWLKDRYLHYRWNVQIEKLSGPAWGTIQESVGKKKLRVVSIAGTPADGDMGDNVFELRVRMPGGLYEDITVHVPVELNESPAFSSDTLTYSKEVNQKTIIRDGIFIPDHCSDKNENAMFGFGDRLEYSIISGPAWLQISPIGRLFGAASDEYVGKNKWTIQVKDYAGKTAQTALVINVKEVNLPPNFSEIIVKNVRMRRRLSGTVASYCSDPNPSDRISYSITSGPSWLKMKSDGSLAGTAPSTLGESTITIQADDGRGGLTTGTMKLSVIAKRIFVYEPFIGKAGELLSKTKISSGTGWDESPWKLDRNRRRLASPGATFPGIKTKGLMCDNCPDAYPKHPKWRWKFSLATRHLQGTHLMGPNSKEGEIPEIWVSGIFIVDLNKFVLFGTHSIKLGDEFSFGKISQKKGGTFQMKLFHETVQIKMPAQMRIPAKGETHTTWFVTVRIRGEAGKRTKAKLYAISKADASRRGINMRNPETFPVKSAEILADGQLKFDQVQLHRYKESFDFIDEIHVAETYADCITTEIGK